MTENKVSFMQEQKKITGEIFRRNVMLGVYSVCGVANALLAGAAYFTGRPESALPLLVLAVSGLTGAGYNYGEIAKAEERLRPPQPIIGEPKPSFRPEPKSPIRQQSEQLPATKPTQSNTESRIPEPKPPKRKVYPRPHDTLGKIGKGGNPKDMEDDDAKFGG